MNSLRIFLDALASSTPQINTWTSDWVKFYAEHRLGYQLKLALDQYGDSLIHAKGLFSILFCKNFESD